jgi:DNA polymerase III epsilon subunit-like protein
MLFSILDTETTGLPLHPAAPLENQPHLIEVGSIITDGKDIIEVFEFICNPRIAIEQIITDITGLTNDDLRDQPPFEHYLPQLQEHFAKVDAVIAHNLSFDRGMFEFDLRRLGLTLTDIRWPSIEICTVEQSFPLYGRRMKLQELYSQLVGPYVQKHRAVDDARLLHEVCKAIGVYDAFSAPTQSPNGLQLPARLRTHAGDSGAAERVGL